MCIHLKAIWYMNIVYVSSIILHFLANWCTPVHKFKVIIP